MRREQDPQVPFQSLSEKRKSLCKLCGPLCLCGENTQQKPHHRDTEITRRTTELLFPDKTLKGLSKIVRATTMVCELLQSSLFAIDLDPRALPWAGNLRTPSAFRNGSANQVFCRSNPMRSRR